MRVLQPERGISAIRMAADAIDRMELGRLDAEHDRECRLDPIATARPT